MSFISLEILFSILCKIVLEVASFIFSSFLSIVVKVKNPVIFLLFLSFFFKLNLLIFFTHVDFTLQIIYILRFNMGYFK